MKAIKVIGWVMGVAGMYRPKYRWMSLVILMGSFGISGVRGDWVSVVSIKQLSEYIDTRDKSVPTCRSQFYYILFKDATNIIGVKKRPFVHTKYYGVEGGVYMPNPDKWDTWEKDASGVCNQDTDLVCKQRVVCKMIEFDIPSAEDLNPSYDPFESNVGRLTPRCTLCVPVACPDASCPFGKIQGSPLVAFNNLVYQRPSCRETCAAGTFLTCNTGLDCRYQAPSTYHVSGDVGARAWLYLNQYTVKSDLNLGGGWPLPASGCYPCKFANGRTHFGTYFGTDATLYQDNFLQFECPGGALGPRACGRNKVAKFDNATGIAGGCYCRDGWYKANAGDEECTKCPAGYWCKWDKNTPPTKKECDVDMYSFEGQTECRNCTVNTNICPKSQALTRCVRGNNGEYQSRDAFCTDCGNCRQITNADGALPCNRVISVVSAQGAAI
jgi:hypothetical protein